MNYRKLKTSISSHSYRRWISCEFVTEDYFHSKRFFFYKKMRFFQTIRKQYAIMGISSSNQWTPELPFSERVLLGFLLFGCAIISHLVYTFHVADGFIEYVECICTTSASIIVFICFVAIVLRKTKLFETIDNIKKLIDTSETILRSNLRLYR